MIRDRRDLLLAGLGLAGLFTFAFGHRPDDGVGVSKSGLTVRVAYFPNVTHAPALVGVARNTFAHALGSNGLRPVVVNAGPEAMEALLAGEIDFAYVGPGPAINTYVKSHGKALRILAGACSGGASLVSRDGTTIRSVRDLDGLRVAVPQTGGTQDISLRHFLAQSGLQSKEQRGSVEIISAKNPDILALFLRKQIDAAWVPEPWASRLVDELHGRRVVDERDLWPGRTFPTTLLVVRSAFADRHPDIVRQFVAANRASIDWLKQNPAEGQELVNRELLRLSSKRLSSKLLAEAWTRVTFSSDLNPRAIEQMADSARETGYLTGPIPDLREIYALSSEKGVR